MISRVAEACFWLHRHMERADAVSRLLRINREFVLDAPLEESRKWYPLLIVSGEHERFDEAHGTAERSNGDRVQEYLTWDRDNPVSIHSALYWARENARVVREVISLDTWRALNGLWHALMGEEGRRLHATDPDVFYRKVCEGVAMFHGTVDSTIVHDAAFDFMRMGMFLERANQTARLLDVHHHTFDTETRDREYALARVQWLSLLHSCSATTPFLRRVRASPNGRRILGFLVLDDAFPRAVTYCLRRALYFLGRIRDDAGRGGASTLALAALADSLSSVSADELWARGVHEELTRIVISTSEVCNAIRAEFLDPDLAPATETATPTQ